MIAALLVLIVCGLAAYLIWQTSEQPPSAVDPEAALRAAAELHAIRRRLDVEQLQHEQRWDARRLKRELAETLGANHDAP